MARLYEHLFRLLGKMLGTNIRFLGKNATLVTISHGVSVLRGLVTGYLVARLFPREMYGQYQFILSIAGAVAVFGLPGMGNALSRAIARGEKGISLPVARIQFLFSLTGSAILLTVIPFLPAERADLWPLFLVAATIFPLSHTAINLFAGITIGNARFDTTLRANLTWSILVIIATLAILFFHPSALLLYATVTILPALAYLLFSRPFLQNTQPPPPVEHIVRYGINLTSVSLPMTLSWYLDKLIISATLGLNQLAIFSVALLIPDQVKVWVKELLPISFAMQAKGEDSWERRKRLIRIVGRSTLFFLIGIIVYILLAPLLFALLFPNYPEAVLLSQIFSVTLLAIPGTLIGQYMEAQGMLAALRRSQWLSSIIFIAATIGLIPIYGLLGAVGARCILRISYVCFTWLFFLRTPLPATTPK
jgi:O-antigen/teichoic acid export membrane protein